MHFGFTTLKLLVAVVHLLYDEVGARVLGQVVVVGYYPAPLGVPFLLAVHPQQQGRLVIGPLQTLHLDVIAAHFLDAGGAHAVSPRALAHHMSGVFCHLTFTLPAHQLPGLVDLCRDNIKYYYKLKTTGLLLLCWMKTV